MFSLLWIKSILLCISNIDVSSDTPICLRIDFTSLSSLNNNDNDIIITINSIDNYKEYNQIFSFKNLFIFLFYKTFALIYLKFINIKL